MSIYICTFDVIMERWGWWWWGWCREFFYSAGDESHAIRLSLGDSPSPFFSAIVRYHNLSHSLSLALSRYFCWKRRRIKFFSLIRCRLTEGSWWFWGFASCLLPWKNDVVLKAFEKNWVVRSGIWTHALSREPELESGALDHSAILTPLIKWSHNII